MTRLITAVLLAIGAAPAAHATEPQAGELLSKVDVSDPIHGTKIFGEQKVNLFEAPDGSLLLVHQARFGGDGEHTENRLKLFRFAGREWRRLLDENIESVTFVERDGVLTQIRGEAVELLCDVCDGWDAAEPRDVFFIPVVIDVRTLAVTSTLDAQGRRALLARLHARAKENTSEQTAHGDPRGALPYAAFAAAVTKRVEELLAR